MPALLAAGALVAALAGAAPAESRRMAMIEALAAAAQPGAAEITEADLLSAERDGEPVFAVRRDLGVVLYLPALRRAGAHPRADHVVRWRALGAVVEPDDVRAALARRRR